MSTKYEIHLDGVHALDLSMGVLRDLADLVVEGAMRATRLAAEGRSTARGTVPAWLAEAADVRLVGFREGSLSLDLCARPLAEVAPQVFGTSAGTTAFDLLMEAVDDALHGRRDSERLDGGVLQVLMKTRSLFGRGPSQLRITRPGGDDVVLAEAAFEKFQRLADATPRPQIDRLVGVLDSLTISTRTCQVMLDDGGSLRGYIGPGVSLDELKQLFGQDVMIEGTLVFRPSGRPQRVEIDHVAPASQRDVIWRRTPRGQLALDPSASASGDVAAFYGQWPGDEDDEQVFAALKELS